MVGSPTMLILRCGLVAAVAAAAAVHDAWVAPPCPACARGRGNVGRFPLVSADFWTSDHLSERSRSVDAFSGTRARGTLTLKRLRITLVLPRWEARASPRDDLRPVSGGGLDWLGVSATLYDSLDALYVCGLRGDYDRAVARVFAPSWRDPLGRGAPTPYRPVKVFEYHLRVVGGLLGAFEVSGDRRLLGAARHAAEAVAAAFPIRGPPRPYARLAHPRTAPVAALVLGVLDGVRSVFDGGVLCASLAGFGSFGLEFRAIARDGRAPALLERADRVFDAAYARWAADGGAASQKLVPKFYEVPPALGRRRGCLEKHRLSQRAGLGSGGDSFYEYLLKEQLLRGAAGSTKRQAELWDWLAAALLDGARGRDRVADRAGQESEIPTFKGSSLGRFPLVSADFWTSDHLSERSRSVDACSGTRARGTLTLKRR